MSMQIVKLIQGTPEWHAHRAKHFNASDAPAMMGCSSYKSRSDLIKELATGLTPEVDANTQRRFDDGHRFEALARPLAEEIIGDDLSPCVGVNGKYSASFDGLTFMNDEALEHKTLNKALRAVMIDGCTGEDLPMQYRVQMEQQAMVSGCERILFMASEWTVDDLLVEERHCWYEPDAELRAQIIAGWEQLEKDVAAYVPQAAEPKPLPEAKIRDAMPVLKITARGEITASNLDNFKAEVLERINSVNNELETDQQFADADIDARWLRGVSSAMKQAVQKVRSDMQPVDAVLNVLEQLDEIATKKAIDLEKRVKSEKDVRKQVIVQEAQQDLDTYVAALNQRLGANWLPRVAGGFAETIKGLKSLDSMSDKVTVALTNAKLQANQLADRLEANRKHLVQDDGDWIALFADFASVGAKAAEDFQALAALRIGNHKQAEAQRMEAERQRIRAEEEAKAQREANARAAAEAAEQARQLEADRTRIRAEEQAIAQQQAQAAEAERLRIQQQAQADQAEIAQAQQAGQLDAPVAADLASLVADKAVEGVAGIDANQAIAAAQTSAAAVDASSVMTLGQLNTRMEAKGLGRISAATLEFHSIPFTKERSAVQITVVNAKRLMLLISMGCRKLADEPLEQQEEIQ